MYTKMIVKEGRRGERWERGGGKDVSMTCSSLPYATEVTNVL